LGLLENGQGQHKDEEFKNVPGLQVKQAVVLI
jgi:hypothetical protein